MSKDKMPRREANHAPLSPLSYLARSARLFPGRAAVIYGDRQDSWATTYARCRRLASAITKAGIKPGEVVAILAANTPEIYEAHFGVPMAGAVLCTLNTRLDAKSLGYILAHSGARLLITDTEYAVAVKPALASLGRKLKVIDIVDPAGPGGERLGKVDYEAFLRGGDPEFNWREPADEWDTISINYTSGTTGNPKGVAYHYRGAALNAVGNALEWSMPMHPIYLWTVPMFHCNGWCFPWTVAARAGTNICLRKVSAATIYAAIAEYGVDHLCGAPIILSFMINATEAERRTFTQHCKVMTAAAPPPAAVLQSMQEQGFEVCHVYGLTETYGPAVTCVWNPDWDALPMAQQAGLKARQGFANLMEDRVIVADPETLVEVPHDGVTQGEILFRGNIVMKGYLGEEAATAKALAGGWFRSGDLAVVHPDGYLQIRDRAKDIIISGGENISSIEVEDALFRHAAVQAVAVVARPDEKWGETPCAFVELKPGMRVTEAELIAFARANLAHFKCPRSVIFGELPKTSTGKVQKIVLRQQFLR